MSCDNAGTLAGYWDRMPRTLIGYPDATEPASAVVVREAGRTAAIRCRSSRRLPLPRACSAL